MWARYGVVDTQIFSRPPTQPLTLNTKLQLHLTIPAVLVQDIRLTTKKICLACAVLACTESDSAQC